MHDVWNCKNPIQKIQRQVHGHINAPLPDWRKILKIKNKNLKMLKI